MRRRFALTLAIIALYSAFLWLVWEDSGVARAMAIALTLGVLVGSAVLIAGRRHDRRLRLDRLAHDRTTTGQSFIERSDTVWRRVPPEDVLPRAKALERVCREHCDWIFDMKTQKATVAKHDPECALLGTDISYSVGMKVGVLRHDLSFLSDEVAEEMGLRRPPSPPPPGPMDPPRPPLHRPVR